MKQKTGRDQPARYTCWRDRYPSQIFFEIHI